MRNIWRIFRADWQRISASVVAVVVIMGLCLIPCLYAWFNIFSNWDPYGPDATSNIRVAVTSEDEGYELLGLKLNIGSMVLDGLKSNDQMGWEGVRSGRYYAALIVPADFTGDFVSILDTDLRHPQIEYYENEKKNAIAPKITNKAKTAVQDEINATVVETVTNAVTTVSSVCRALGLDADDVSQGVIEKLSSAQDSLRTLEETLTAMQTLADQTDSILACAGVVTGDLDSIVSGNDLSGIQDALDRGIGRLNETEAEIARQLEDIDAQIDVIADDIAAAVGTAEDVAGFLAGPAQQLDQRLAEQQQRLEKLRDFAAGYPAVQERLGNAIYRIGELRDLLKTLENPGQLETWRQEVQAKVDELRQELREAALRISGSVNQRLEELNRDVTEKLQTLQSVFDSVSGNLSALGDKLTRYQEAIQSTGTTLSGAIQLSSTLRGDLGQLAQDMDRIVTSDGFRRGPGGLPVRPRVHGDGAGIRDHQLRQLDGAVLHHAGPVRGLPADGHHAPCERPHAGALPAAPLAAVLRPVSAVFPDRYDPGPGHGPRLHLLHRHPMPVSGAVPAGVLRVQPELHHDELCPGLCPGQHRHGGLRHHHGHPGGGLRRRLSHRRAARDLPDAV